MCIPRVLVALALGARVAMGAETTSLEIDRGERLLVVAPHPDDETLGAGGLMQRVLERGGAVRVVLVTAGDGYVEAVRHDTREPRPAPAEYVAYGERRLAETRAAMRDLGGGRIRVGLLGFPDGALDRLLRAHWGRKDPERSPTTRAARTPYRAALDPNVAYDGDDLRRELLHLLRESQPTLVAFPDPLDRHPDHRAAGLFTLVAVADWKAGGGRVPRLLAYLVHWPGWPPGWDAPPTARQGEAEALTLPGDLPRRGLETVALGLSPKEVTGKGAAVVRYTTQEEIMPAFLTSFVRRTEPFTLFTPAQLTSVGELIAD